MALEKIFDEIGGFGLFQVIMIVWVFGIKCMVGWSMMLMSFAGYIPDYACLTNSSLNQSESRSMDQSELISKAKAGVDNKTFLNVCSFNGTNCEEFSFFGVKKTVISEWHLVCDRHLLKASITSVQMAGVLTGAVIGGQSGDYFGRKKTLYGSYLLHAIFNVVAGFSNSWQMFMALRFFIGIAIGSLLVIVTIYPTESFPLRWRHVIPATPMWPMGVVAFSWAAYLLEDWAYLHFACAVLAVPGLLGYFYIPESARWLATRGRLEESHAVLKKMASVNRKNLPPSAMDTIKSIAESEKNSSKGKDYSYRDLFKTRATAKVTFIFGYKWFVFSLVFYGLSFAVSSFAGDLYLNLFLMAVVDIPAYFLAFVLTDRIGRRWTCLGLLAVAALMSFVCVVIDYTHSQDDLGDRIISASCLTAKLAVSACWSASQAWVVESYPTVTRSLGYGFVNTTSRLGGILAPFFIDLDNQPTFTYILMASLTVIAMLMTYFVPETRNKAMAETITEKTDVIGFGNDQIMSSLDNLDTKVTAASDHKPNFNSAYRVDTADFGLGDDLELKAATVSHKPRHNDDKDEYSRHVCF